MTRPTRNETPVRALIRQELPDLVREDGKIRNLVIEVGRERPQVGREQRVYRRNEDMPV